MKFCKNLEQLFVTDLCGAAPFCVSFPTLFALIVFKDA